MFRGAELILFADGTSLLITGEDEFDLNHKINVISVSEMWFKNNLVINTEKRHSFIQSKRFS
jgi:hypothetical protein